MIRTIRDFLIALTAVIGIELGVRLALAWWEYETAGATETRRAAERLAEDVRNIMLNRGGPTAARTIYPILRRAYEDVGLEIAIVPNEVTVESIRITQGFEPRGLVPEWSEGVHHTAVVELRADEFCLTCHSLASTGDVLGHVEVRNPREHRMDEWWAEARVTGVVGMGNVLLHTLVLFFLLRVRMEPLIELRATVARLAGGRLDLSRRVAVRSDDEFGGLACDLNEFMDRLEHLVQDLDRVLRQIAAVNHRLSQVSSGARRQTDRLRTAVQHALKQAVLIRDQDAGNAEALDDLADALTDMNRVVQEDSYYLSEISMLEERMDTVAENGRILLERIRLSEAEERVEEEEADTSPGPA